MKPANPPASRRLPVPVLLAIALATTLAGCASTPDAVPATPGQPLALAVGERARLPGGDALDYLGVTADSRCPPDVQCVHAGDADLAFRFLPADGVAAPVALNTARAPTAPIGRWQLRVLSLEYGAAPRTTVRIDRRD